MSVPARRVVKRLRPFVQGEHPDPLAPTFTTAAGVPLADITTWTPRARFKRPNGTTIDVVPTMDGATAVTAFPELDETGVWYAEAWVTDPDAPGLEYASDLYVFDVGDPLVAAPGSGPAPGDVFVQVAAGAIPEGYVLTGAGGIAVWAPSTGGGPGGDQVDSVGAGHGIDIAGTATDPVVLVDESELDIALMGGNLLDAQVPGTIARTAAVTAAVLVETNARAAADTAIAGTVTAETAARIAGDALLIPLTQKGAANGVAPLGADGKLGTSFLPALAINETFTAISQAAMLALTAERGDIAVRTDLTPVGYFLLTSDSPTTLADWKQILAPGAVVTVDGRAGAVTLSDLYDPLGAAAAAQAFAIQRGNHSGTQAIATVTGLQAALDAKAPIANPGFTGTPTAPTAAQGTNTTQLATTAMVQSEVALLAPKASPVFTGNPTAPTPATNDNDTSLATTAFVQDAIATYVAAQNVQVFKGVIDCSGNPNYPAADAGHTYRVSVAGKIGGASGPNVEVGDSLLCLVDGTAAGTHAAVGANWSIGQVNIDGAVVGPASATDLRVAVFSGTSGKVIADGGTLLAALAPVASPVFTGDPKAPTPAAGDNDTSLATTAFVAAGFGNRDVGTAVKTSAYTAADGERVRVDGGAAGTITHQLPNNPADGYYAEYKWMAGATPPTMACQGADVFAVTGGATSFAWPATGLNIAYGFLYIKAEHVYMVKTMPPKGFLDATYKPVPVATTLTSSATPAIAVGTAGADVNVSITALAAAITSMTTNLTGTPTDFQKMIVRIKDNGTARAITWGASFEAVGVALPTTTVISKRLTVGFVYDAVSAKWGCVASIVEA